MDNKDKMAFPVNEEITDRIDMGTKIYTGVTKLEFFACNAPNEIPGWFEHVAPEKNITPMPRWQDTPKVHHDYIKAWFMDNQELPEELHWFGVQYKKYEKEEREYRHADNGARYFQWRRYYAEQLLAELSKTQP